MSSPHTENFSRKASLLSNDPSKAMQEMMETIDTLRNIYVRETGALVAANTQAFLDLQQEKLNAARNYQRSIEEIISRKDEMKVVNPLIKKRLGDMQQQFSVLARENMEALARMRRCVSQLGETISNAARKTAKKQGVYSYGENGHLQTSNRKSVSMGISETA